MTEENLVKVGMADLKILVATGSLRTTGLGSCVGLTLYDPVTKIAGMAHVMLPSASIAKEGNLNKAKYADTAIPELIEQMVQAGAVQKRFEAKMAGGAQMFAFSGNSDMMRIGPRNVEMCTELLEKLRIPIKSEDTGGNYGRTIELSSDSGMLSIRSVNKGTKEI
ncbi:chemotaxis protein CheD [Marinicrinis sediminis]|uniref:Probable chemoreceptor glutamine deamidase CheD n=1 Tax=Marinicrinis sediminis TaxID=1652465 RepID=A0ABW5R6N8_9BACL